MLVYIVATITLQNLGFEHHLMNYGSSPPVPLSDMNGSGRFWIGQAWLQVYWSAAAILLALLTYGLWRRGVDARLRARLAHLPRRLAGAPARVFAIFVLVLVASGGWIFYNTNVLNKYRSQIALERELAEYEKTLLAYARDRAPVVGAPGDRRRQAGRRHAGRVLRAVLGAARHGADVRSGPAAQVPQVRTRPVPALARRRGGRGTAARARRGPAVHLLPEGHAGDVLAQGGRGRGQGQSRAGALRQGARLQARSLRVDARLPAAAARTGATR